ncbi:hypothetical protein WOLCODRAFT_84184 [Wolfiporia cocos MD-104 SS10]|uniref:Zn(2)-C6 fungal-type domain-containing protein n=1 Tax=Wolfiporia cocos (strain MD-104) TaxID=742152 RepID=A0A2H3J5Q1_WOLCO|nr:hypothetical protein WOLCODRAFT_84184 [Wolfiporia cocos MD-104 SS10]
MPALPHPHPQAQSHSQPSAQPNSQPHTPHAQTHAHAHSASLALPDDYDDAEGDDLGPLALHGGAHALGLPPLLAASSSAKGEKTVRRRSSKACDQCRKSKCKCERAGPQDPCRNCVMLGTPCTFLGPSRKRGPPKGYIDAIEARLHQTEALIGILLGSRDARARGVLADLGEDPLAKEIITRVDNSPYGHKGRLRGGDAAGSGRSRPSAEMRDEAGVHSTHPSNEWQDQVIARLNAVAAARNTLLAPQSAQDEAGDADARAPRAPSPAPLSASPVPPDTFRRQRRRLSASASVSASPGTSRERAEAEAAAEEDEEPGEDELAIEVGQLSLNEDEQVRFHGKMSGLHLLAVKDRADGRHDGGIWRFPKARVWPPLPPTASTQAKGLENFAPRLPDQGTQELLLELYWTYVHPALPIVHKHAFMEDFRNSPAMSADSPYSEASDGASPRSGAGSSPAAPKRRGRVPTLLLLAMFAIAARYSAATSADVPAPEEGRMWAAGDAYLEDAKVILDSSYAASRPSTVQALLLLAYREVGIGAMAQAWLFVGMAVRMAQDLGLHKRAEMWARVGRTLFTPVELQERRRVWFGCVVMDKYVSAYIGRPVAIFERDFDTELPSIDEVPDVMADRVCVCVQPDELEAWAPHPSAPLRDDSDEPRFPERAPVPGHVVSCFAASATLSVILSQIMQTLYAISPPAYRQAEFARFERELGKWYHELPAHLVCDPAAARSPAPLPHVLTLHMQYWCSVLLLHRPFIRHCPDTSNRPTSSSSKDSETRATSRKNYDICVQAANHITSIVSVYMENYTAKRAPVYLCYYVFTAAIMHVATLMTYSDDAQARVGLNRCMDVLKRMRILWGSAWRALELLQGSKVNVNGQGTQPVRARVPERPKRAAEHALEGEPGEGSARLLTSEQMYRQPQAFSAVGTPPPVGQNFSMGGLQMPAADAGAYPGYERWSAEGAMPAYGGSLSTSVLPQQYSTGLVDERMSSGMSRHAERGQRYPQYWSDYSALGQMDAPYGVPVIGEMVSQHPGAAQGEQPSMYVQDYSMFGQ